MITISINTLFGNQMISSNKRLTFASIFVTRVTRTEEPLQSDSEDSKILQEYIINGLESQLNDRMTSLPVNFRFYRRLKILFSKIFIAPKDSP